jgi:hypothetical protein
MIDIGGGGLGRQAGEEGGTREGADRARDAYLPVDVAEVPVRCAGHVPIDN